MQHPVYPLFSKPGWWAFVVALLGVAVLASIRTKERDEGFRNGGDEFGGNFRGARISIESIKFVVDSGS